ncbi:MAG: PorT family protein [Cytophagales bacterium]|nr:MAG: PorT family protein [Cytophagales bacterium]TAF61652.1 MAG: PorT family protein [Cytophagales bacterium]
MKKHLFLLVIIVLAWGGFKAQAQEKNTLSIGLTVGPNISLLTGQGAGNNYTPRLGFVGGALLNYSVSNSIGLGAELTYANKGGNFRNNVTIADIRVSQRINYIDVPIYMNYFFGEGESRPKLFFGANLSLLTSAKIVTKNTSTDFKDTEDNSEGFRSTDAAFLIGAGWHKRVGEGIWLILDARLSHSLSSIVAINPAVQNDVRNTTLSLRAAITMPLNLPKK